MLPLSFYLRTDVVQITRELLGKVLVTDWNGGRTAGRIVEAEAYAGQADRASHAFRGKTPRTQVLFGPGGTAYVYLCYGIHHLFNIVTNAEGTPHAILVRAVEPLEGISIMLQRTGKKVPDVTLTRGPGNVGKAFGFHTSHTGLSLLRPQLYIADDGFVPPAETIAAAPRIGVDYAGADALLPYRFYLKGNVFVSKSKGAKGGK